MVCSRSQGGSGQSQRQSQAARFQHASPWSRAEVRPWGLEMLGKSLATWAPTPVG